MNKTFQLLLSLLSVLPVSVSFSQELGLSDKNDTTDYQITDWLVNTKLLTFDIEQSTGRRVFTWHETEDSTTVYKDIYVRVYDKDMIPLTSEIRVNKDTTNDQTAPFVVVNQENETFLVCWTGNQSGNYDIYAKKFSFSSVSTDAAENDLKVNVNVDNPSSSTTTGTQNNPKAAFDYDLNEAIVGWRDQASQDGSGFGTYVRRIDYSDFSLIGDQFLVNERTTDHQSFEDIKFNPLTGEIYCLYASHYNTADCNSENQNEVMLRRLYRNADSTFSGHTEVIVNSRLCDSQYNPYLYINEKTGYYIITYTSNNKDGWWSRGAYARIFDNSHQAVDNSLQPGGAEFKISNSSTGHYRFRGRVAWDYASNAMAIFYIRSNNSSFSYIEYVLLDDNFIRVQNETDALGVNTNSFEQRQDVKFDQVRNKVLLSYHLHDSWNSSDCDGYFRQFDFYHDTHNNYSSLQEELSGCYHAERNRLNFRFDNKYFAGPTEKLQYAIYDWQRNKLSTPQLALDYGMNYYSIDLKSIPDLSLDDSDVFVLEVTDMKGVKKYLRFRYVPEF